MLHTVLIQNHYTGGSLGDLLLSLKCNDRLRPVGATSPPKWSAQSPRSALVWLSFSNYIFTLDVCPTFRRLENDRCRIFFSTSTDAVWASWRDAVWARDLQRRGASPKTKGGYPSAKPPLKGGLRGGGLSPLRRRLKVLRRRGGLRGGLREGLRGA